MRHVVDPDQRTLHGHFSRDLALCVTQIVNETKGVHAMLERT